MNIDMQKMADLLDLLRDKGVEEFAHGEIKIRFGMTPHGSHIDPIKEEESANEKLRKLMQEALAETAEEKETELWST